MEHTSAPAARLSLLGDFALTFAGEELPVAAPAQRLLALLAVCHRERPVGRAALAERLWPDAAPGRATSTLRSVLWRLPRPRGRVLVIGTATQVRLSPDLRVDVWDGEELAGQLCGPETPSVELLADLGPLTRDLLPSWHEEWLPVEQESYRQQRLHALERCAHALLERERFNDALAAGLGAVRSEPLRESAHRRVIEVHLAEGNHAEALRQYDSYRRLLARELGISPSPAIRRLLAPLLGRPIDA
ncbi:AfsR/SARP family transcriptional regulator [Nocardioides pantholopis]|uniref:AfsR/SARP family transcriptional regulator n=1 Tax=Nocardioides pantholopis TaxID=2483798 RepID=UPI0013E3B8B2|nr:BTAD domain-containing putative transcriptional regulator [Nocardioides pantholopis]